MSKFEKYLVIREERLKELDVLRESIDLVLEGYYLDDVDAHSLGLPANKNLKAEDLYRAFMDKLKGGNPNEAAVDNYIKMLGRALKDTETGKVSIQTLNDIRSFFNKMTPK